MEPTEEDSSGSYELVLETGDSTPLWLARHGVTQKNTGTPESTAHLVHAEYHSEALLTHHGFSRSGTPFMDILTNLWMVPFWQVVEFETVQRGMKSMVVTKV